MLTQSQVEGHMYAILRDGTLNSLVSGSVYREGYRPRDSHLEDIVVSFTAGTTGQIQTGELTVSIYVPDIDPFANGVMVKDGRRLQEIETAASRWIEDNVSSGAYRLTLADTIRVREVPELGQHCVVMHVGYQYYN